MKLLKEKKGSLQDIVLIGAFILVFALVALFAFRVSTDINDYVQGSEIFDSRGKAASSDINGFFPTVVDNTFLLFTIGIAIVVLSLALFVRIHPIFIPLYIIGLIVVIFVSGILSNIYQESAANAHLATQASQLVFISTILEFLPVIIGIFGTLLMVVMYKLWRADQFA